MCSRFRKVSELKFNVDFFAGYSPERINPGNKGHTVTKILKVTSGSTPEVAEYVDQLYKSVITAGTHRATELIKHMMRKDLKMLGAKVLILGFPFKENCPDYRNTWVIDIYHELKSFDMDVDIFDPWVNTEEVKKEYGVELLNSNQVPDIRQYSAIVLVVAYKVFEETPLRKFSEQVSYDVKITLAKEDVDARL